MTAIDLILAAIFPAALILVLAIGDLGVNLLYKHNPRFRRFLDRFEQ